MNELHLLRPYWLLALIPLLILCWKFWHQKFHSRSWQAVCDPRLLPHILIGSGGRQRKWPVLLMAVTGILVIVALAGPVWEKLKQPVFREQSALVIVVDLSRSMDATDIKPSRLTRARHKIIDILKQRKEGQTALIVYASDAFVVSPLTQDADTMVLLVKTLTTDLMPAQGSQPQKAVKHAVQLMRQAGVHSGDILLITDGIHESQAQQLVKLATDNHHTLSVLGIGTKQGAPISMPGGGFLKDSTGAIVLPKLNQNELRQLAHNSGGRYHSLTTDDKDLTYLLQTVKTQKMDANLEETDFMSDQWREEGPWLILLVLPFAALAFRRGYLAVLIIFLLPAFPEPANAIEWDNLWKRPDQQATEKLRQQNTEDKNPSPEIFKEPEWKAAAYYRAGQYQQAIESLQGIDNADAQYNTGNALAKMGSLPDAIKAYDKALEKNPKHEDAKYNRELVKKKLEEQQQSNDQQQQDKNQEDSGEKNEDQSGEDQKGNEQDQKQSDANESDSEQNQQQADSNQEEEDNNNQEMNQSDQSEQSEQQENKTAQQKEKEEQESKAAKNALSEDNEKTEEEQANEQWLRRIPDDPGGLLRRKFQYEYQRRLQRQQANGQRNDTGNGQQSW